MHTFMNKKSKGNGSLIEALSVDAYPTYILLDKELTIVFRGTSQQALYEIEKRIQAYSIPKAKSVE